MKKKILYLSKLFLLLLFLGFNCTKAQTTIFTENFESITSGNVGTWQRAYFGTLSPASYPYNIFAVQSSCATNLIAGTKSMQVTGLTSSTTAVCDYQNINPSNHPNYEPLIYHQINATGYNNITLSYKWKCNGEINYDFGRLVYSTDGTNWTILVNNMQQGNTNTVTVNNYALPAALANTTFYIGWSFKADASVRYQPGLTIDDIEIKGNPLVTCDPITATASKYVICSGESVTLTANSTSPGYAYTWYTDWDNDTHTGTLVGTGSSINVNPTSSILYGVVATKTGCPTGVNAAYQLISIFVTPPPTLIVLDPIEAITCSNELREINVVSGGEIPNEALDENWDPIKNPWTTNASVGTGGNANNALWYLYASGGIASPDNSNFAMVDSDVVGPYTIESSLVSSPFSLLDYNTPINLTFNHYYSTFNNYPLWYSTATVEVSEDGENWTVLKTYTGSDVGGPTNFAAESINMNAYSGKPFLQLRFHYTGRYDDVWAIDDIKITGSPKPTTITWLPLDGLYTDTLGTQYTGGHATTLYASPVNTTTYTVLAKTAVGCPAEAHVTVERGDKIWGGTNTNWNTTANWSEGTLPTANHCVNIPNTTLKPIILAGTDAFAKNLTVQSGGNLNITGNLTVTDFVKNEGADDNIVIESDGNLKQINDAAINIGNITAKRDLVLSTGNEYIAARQQYNYLISPTEGTSLSTIYGAVPVPYVLYHQESNNKFYASSGAYIKGRGLAVKEPAASFTGTTMPATFIGKPVNGAFPYTIVNSGTSDPNRGFNLIGNPYPSNIDLMTFYTLNGGSGGNVESTAYFWDNKANNKTTQQGDAYGGQSYGQFNMTNGTGIAGAGDVGATTIPTRYVKTAQGFMVKSKVASATINFNNTIRTTLAGNGFFGKDSGDGEMNRYWLNMISPANIASNIAVVYFPEGNNGFSQDDSRSMGGSDAVYSIVEDEKVSINGRSNFIDTDVIPLGTQHFTSGNYTIALGNKEGIFANGQNIYLKDKQTGIITNLSQGNYTFAANAGASTGRFEIIYKPETVLATDSSTKEELSVYRDMEDFVIKAQTKKITDVEVYDTGGRLLYKTQPNNTKAIIPAQYLIRGVYILKISQDTQVTMKKVIR